MTSTNPPAPMRALVVDDNAVNRKVAELFLLRLGLLVGHATSGVEALNALAAVNYDVILMDVQMPEMDGLEATKQFRLQGSGPRPPRIIAVTADGDRKSCIQA